MPQAQPDLADRAAAKRLFGKRGLRPVRQGPRSRSAIVGARRGLARCGASATGSRASPGSSPRRLLPVSRCASPSSSSAACSPSTPFLAVGDYRLPALHAGCQRQRMTKQELKDEYKETEGNPEIKARLRQIRMRSAAQAHDGGRARRRPSSSPTRPTTRSRCNTSPAWRRRSASPRASTRSRCASARSPRSTASRSSRTRRSPARCYASVEIDDEIPVEHYKAVAEVIGYVLRLQRRRVVTARHAWTGAASHGSERAQPPAAAIDRSERPGHVGLLLGSPALLVGAVVGARASSRASGPSR